MLIVYFLRLVEKYIRKNEEEELENQFPKLQQGNPNKACKRKTKNEVLRAREGLNKITLE